MSKHKKSGQNKAPLVSIITICRNFGGFIEDTMLSVFNQDYPNIEYIVIDGGSTDGSVDIIKKHKDRLSYWVSEPDQGISDALNKGIRQSTGQVIGLIHAGDCYTRGAIRTVVDALLSNPDYGFAFGNLEYIDEKGQSMYRVNSDKDYLNTLRFTLPAMPHPTIFMRKEVYDTCGLFDISYKIALDYEHLLRITRAGIKGLYINKTLARMRYGGISYSSFYDGYKEVERASVKYGYNTAKARVRLYLKGTRGLIRVGMERLGLHGLIKILRKTIWGVKYG